MAPRRHGVSVLEDVVTSKALTQALTLHESYFQTVVDWENWLTKSGADRHRKLLLYQLIDTTIERSKTQAWQDADLASTSDLEGALDTSRYQAFKTSVESKRADLEVTGVALAAYLSGAQFTQAYENEADYVTRASLAATVTTGLGHSAAGRMLQHKILTDPDHALHPRNVCFPENPDPVIFPGGKKARISDQNWKQAKTALGSVMSFVNNLSGAVVGEIKTADETGEAVQAVARLIVPYLLAMDDLFKSDLPNLTRTSTLELLDLIHRGSSADVLATISVEKLQAAMDNARSDLTTKTGDLLDLNASTNLVGFILTTAGFADLLVKYAEYGELAEPPSEEFFKSLLSFSASAGALAEAIEKTNGSWVDEALPSFKPLSTKLGKRLVKFVSKFAILGPVGDFIDLVTAPPHIVKNLQVNDYSVAAGHTLVAAGAGMSLLALGGALSINPFVGAAVLLVGALIVAFTVDPPLERWINETYFGGNAGDSSLYDDPGDLVYRWYDGETPDLDRHIAGYFSTVYGFTVSVAGITKLDDADESYVFKNHDEFGISESDRSDYYLGQVTIKTSLAYPETAVGVRTLLRPLAARSDDVPAREYDQFEGKLMQSTPAVAAERQNLSVYQFSWSNQYKHTVTAPKAVIVPKLKSSVQTNDDGTTKTLINEWTLEVADKELANLFSAVSLDYEQCGPHIEVTLALEQLLTSLASQANIQPGGNGGATFTIRAAKHIDTSGL